MVALLIEKTANQTESQQIKSKFSSYELNQSRRLLNFIIDWLPILIMMIIIMTSFPKMELYLGLNIQDFAYKLVS